MNDLNPTRPPRAGEEIDAERLAIFLKKVFPRFEKIEKIGQFGGGFSNLTYLIETNFGPLVLRRPPFGAAAKGGHDMAREFKILQAVEPFFSKIPRPLAFCDDLETLGAPFFLMEKTDGLILRSPAQADVLGAKKMAELSAKTASILAEIHAIKIEKTPLEQVGKADGFLRRQVDGWAERWQKSKTDAVPAMEKLAAFLTENCPKDGQTSLIHNDFKFDNLVFEADENGSPMELRAVLDWEMATIGSPVADLGTAMAYWFEKEEAVPGFSGPTTAAGCLSRAEFLQIYFSERGEKVPADWPFFHAFGLFKIAVICQQIFARWQKGLTRDPRFGALGQVVQMLAAKGWRVAKG